jgi:hypothetical protein
MLEQIKQLLFSSDNEPNPSSSSPHQASIALDELNRVLFSSDNELNPSFSFPHQASMTLDELNPSFSFPHQASMTLDDLNPSSSSSDQASMTPDKPDQFSSLFGQTTPTPEQTSSQIWDENTWQRRLDNEREQFQQNLLQEQIAQFEILQSIDLLSPQQERQFEHVQAQLKQFAEKHHVSNPNLFDPRNTLP